MAYYYTEAMTMEFSFAIQHFFFSEKIILKESKFYVEGHHEAIVSREVFEKA